MMFDVTTPKPGASLRANVDRDPSPFDSVSLPPSVRRSAVETVIDTIERLILTKRLRPGDRLPSEFELTRTLATSRGSIREAIKILSSFGVLEIRRGDGTYVSESMSRRLFDHLLFQMILSDPDKRMLKELRELIEIGIVQLVLANARDEDLRAIELEVNRMASKVAEKDWDPRTLTDLDLAFHRSIAKATQNELIQRIYDFTLDLFAHSIEETHRHKRKGLNALRCHKRILEGLLARDAAATAAAVRESIEQWAILS
jgi:GntR family transcriptional regulator, transcriptional repressor for pyruvate dehydrogenase complex